MVSIETAIQEFPKTLKKHSTRNSKNKLEKMAQNIQTVRTTNPAAYSDEQIEDYLRQRAKVLYDLVEKYFTTAISQKFPLLSDELFELKRYLTIETIGKKSRVLRDNTDSDKRNLRSTGTGRNQKIITKTEIPLFAYTPLLKGDHKATLGKFTRTRRIYNSYYNYRSTHRTTTKVEAKLPGTIGQNLRAAYKEALGHYFSIMAKAYAEPVVGEVLLQKPEQTNPEIGAIWIPTPESLSIITTEEVIERKPIDPAMILTARGKKYLVKTWEVDDEEPFEKYLREYSIGDLKGKLKQ